MQQCRDFVGRTDGGGWGGVGEREEGRGMGRRSGEQLFGESYSRCTLSRTRVRADLE